MKLGLNLSFAVKRWIEPERLASLVKHDFATDHVQVTWDLIDPWWPAQQRGEYARRFREAFEREGVVIDSTFSGLAAYSYPQLLAPDELQRGIALQFFKRAVDMTAELGAEVMGAAIGALSYDDARNPQRREFLYHDMLKRTGTEGNTYRGHTAVYGDSAQPVCVCKNDGRSAGDGDSGPASD